MSVRVRRSVAGLKAYVPGEQPRDGRYVKLNTNECPYPPSPLVKQALEGMGTDLLRLYPDPVSQELRTAIAELHGRTPAEVFVGNGLDEVLSLCVRGFVENDGAVGYMEPSYSLYPVLADIRGLGKRPVPLGPRFEWRMPAGYSADIFLLTNPNAPTGLRCDMDLVREFCRGFGGLVVVDEAYVDFSDGHCMDLASSEKNVLVLRSLSKSYSLAGVRIGYAVGAEESIRILFKIKDSYNLDRVSQALACAAIRDQAHMRANVERIKTTRARLSAALSGMGWEVYPSQANFIWTRPAGHHARAVYEALRRKKVLVRHFDGPRTGDYLRISIGTDAEIDTLLTAIRDIAKEGGAG